MPSDVDRIIGLYQRQAAAFDRDRSRSLCEKPWLDRFLGELPGRSVLDLGCGHGEPIARYLVEQGRAVTGVDASPPLIELARGRFPDQAWIIGDMRTINLGARFDGILAWHSFFHLSPDDQRAMFRVLAAHTRPGSVLMLVTGPEFGEAIGCYEGEPLYHASLDRAEYRACLTAHGFEVIEGVPDFDGAVVWLARRTSFEETSLMGGQP